MAKKKLTPAPPTEQAPRTVPLEAITITWMRPVRYLGEEGDQPTTITGRQLAPILRWLSLMAPGGDWAKDFGNPEDTTWLVECLADVMSAIRDPNSVDHDTVLCFFAHAVPDLTNRMRAHVDGDATAKAATVTIDAMWGAAA